MARSKTEEPENPRDDLDWWSDYDEDDEDGDSGTEDDSDDVDESEDDDDGDDGEDAVRQKIYQEVIDTLANEDTDSPIYKGMQRHLSDRDKKIAGLEKSLSEQVTGFQEYQESASEALNLLLARLHKALPEEDQKDLEQAVKELTQQREVRRLSRQQSQQQQQGNPGGVDEINEQLAEAREKFVGGLRKHAQEMGVDPKDERLDFGRDDDDAATRNERFLASMKKILDEDKEAAGVTQKPRPKTRGSESGAPAKGRRSLSSEELITLGARQRLPKSVRGRWK